MFESRIDLLKLFGQEAATLTLKAGEELFAQGADGTDLYLLRTGRVEVLVDGGLVAIEGPGAVIGELSALDGKPRSATVRAAEESTLVPVSRERLAQVLTEQPALASHLVKVLASRVRRADDLALAESLQQYAWLDRWFGNFRLSKLLSSFFVFLLFFSGIAYFAYSMESEQILERERERLQSIAKIKADELDVWIGERHGDLIVLAHNPQLAELPRLARQGNREEIEKFRP